jgi:hypothetical protein
MKIFISYASEDRDLAEKIKFKLVGEGHQVFFDKTSLPTARPYDLSIKNAVESADIFVFLISPDSVKPGSYALTELMYAEQNWINPEENVVPVLARKTPFDEIPNYLTSVTFLQTEGDVPAAVLLAIQSLAVKIPLIHHVHRYSGTWSVRNSFSLWRDRPIKKPDTVFFVGKTWLLIPTEGEGGSGIQIGKLHVHVSGYNASYDIVNEISKASVDKAGTLRMNVKEIRHQLTKEDPLPLKAPHAEDDYADLRRDLETKEWELELDTVSDKPMQLKGRHKHEEALDDVDQRAGEKYVYEGLFIPPGLSDQ